MCIFILCNIFYDKDFQASTIGVKNSYMYAAACPSLIGCTTFPVVLGLDFFNILKSV